jgi:glutaredoxin 3
MATLPLNSVPDTTVGKPMPAVIIYTSIACPYCLQAKRLLTHKGVAYREIDVTTDIALRQEMIQASGRRTVPQIFIGEQSIGGFEELYELEQSGALDDLLSGG